MLKPCPFCGSHPGPLATKVDGQLMCDVCGARGPRIKFEWMDGEDGILGRWNIRDEARIRRETIKECKKAVGCAMIARTSPLEALCALADPRPESRLAAPAAKEGE